MQSRRCVPAMIGSELEHSGALGGVCKAPPWTAVPRGRSVRDWAARGCTRKNDDFEQPLAAEDLGKCGGRARFASPA